MAVKHNAGEEMAKPQENRPVEYREENGREDGAADAAAVREEGASAESDRTDAQDTAQVSVKRRMPDNLRRFLLKVQGGKYYLPAAYRIVWFRDECPDWGVVTSLIEGGHAAAYATVQAQIINPSGRVISTGLKTESRQDFPAGWVEKAETGAIARALAVAGFGTQFSPELDDDASHPADTPQRMRSSERVGMVHEAPVRSEDRSAAVKSTGDEIWPGPGQCPNCHAPEGKLHGKPCRN